MISSVNSAPRPLSIGTAAQSSGPNTAQAANAAQNEELNQNAVEPTSETNTDNRIAPQATPNILTAGGDDNTNAEGLTPEEVEIVEELQQRDEEVRAHEQAHSAVGGPYAGAPQYQLETGPDGNQYAVAGEVQIDVSPVAGNPAATIRKMEIVARAALAPAEPSPQDRQVALQAQQIKLEAQVELQEQQQAERNEENGEGDESPIDAVLAEAIERYSQASKARTDQAIDINI